MASFVEHRNDYCRMLFCYSQIFLWDSNPMPVAVDRSTSLSFSALLNNCVKVVLQPAASEEVTAFVFHISNPYVIGRMRTL